MYSINGDFGKVRLCRQTLTNHVFSVPYKLTTGGWHKCNDKYMIRRVHGMGEYVFLFNRSSGGIAQIGTQKWYMKEDSIMLLPPHDFHEYYTDIGKVWEFYWLCAEGPNLNQILLEVTNKYGFYYENMEIGSIIEKYETLFPGRFLDSSEAYDIKASQIISEILHEFLLKLCNQTSNTSQSGIVNSILKELEENYKNEINIKNIAEENHISPQYLIKIFKTETGYPPYEYLKKYRLSKAAELLAYSQKDINEIAEETEFSSTSNFIFQFKKEKNTSPGTYRKLMKKERINNHESKKISNEEIPSQDTTAIVQKALRYIVVNYRDMITVEAISRHCNISISYFSKIFKKETGLTLTQYVNDFRLHKAAEELFQSQNTVLEIVMQSGFQNLSYFIRMFKKEFGVTPGEYRKKGVDKRIL